ncbi:hypothetical protein J1P26_08535 [Neobacillus sp. MM2021_6]|uniref:hypothetical protein n=1 Tax=Bacillaceae TaxID=186817 RepID=UPI001407A9D4|nr:MULTISPECIES: hypothetical protein [Bacillaceae]MBO0959769.1 hypothetical protein [Neobacillus sp. MM2021_6]NHC19151.1 hypothetical protein [Bacillus sp. MM2020_4]
MKYQKSIHLLVIVITLLSIFATASAILSSNGSGEYNYQSVFGETITVFGKGLYQHDSVSMAAQAIAQDYVTLFLGIPLLLFSLYLSRKGQVKGKLLLTGTLGYFLYTYASYSFLAMYNSLFLIYVSLMSLSFFAFTLAMMSFELATLPLFFKEKLPVTFISCFLIAVSFMFGAMWIGKIVPPLIQDKPPVGIEHYTTLVIQALDLGFVIPIGILAGLLLMKRKPFGYLLSSIIIIKQITLLTALTAMAILQIQTGQKGVWTMLAIILPFNLIVIFCLYLIMINIKEIGERVSGTIRGHVSS